MASGTVIATVWAPGQVCSGLHGADGKTEAQERACLSSSDHCQWPLALQPNLDTVRGPFYRQGRQLADHCHTDWSMAEVRFESQSLLQSRKTKAALCSWRNLILIPGKSQLQEGGI